MRDLLPDTCVHLWVLRTAEAADPELLAAYLDLLSPDERARHHAFLAPGPRDEHLRARALTRTVLARYAGVPPRELAFVEGERGRPELASPIDGRRLRFNLSHTRGLIALVVGWELDVGVDVEDSTRRGDPLGLAESVFARDELEALRALPAARQRERFFTYWTLKEAYIKARGLGLLIPLDAFSFCVDDPDDLRVRLDPSLEDDARAWQFTHSRPTPEHHLALGLRVGDGPRRRVVWRWTVPLREASPAAREGL
jgi:4'-phosphopantetheinyl transferase